VLCWANALLLAWAFIRSSQGGDLGAELLPAAGLVEPVCFITLAGLCAARDPMARLPALLRTAVASALAGALTLLVLRAARLLPGLVDDQLALQPVMLMAAAAALVQHLIDLRVQVLGPALAEARLDALQSRIRPHFLFNSLNAVLALMPEDSRRAERVLEDLAELFRALLGDHRRLMPVAVELDLCRRYLEIEQERLGERLQVDWQVAQPLPEAWLPPLLLQPLVENAVVHGIEALPADQPQGPGPAGRAIVIQVGTLGSQLRVIIANPRPSILAEGPPARQGHGSGLANVRERLALHYDFEASLEVESDPERFLVRLLLPLGRPG
jgi:two-component system sensor histidine kinase AlgZ